ncbi:hypothetical protein MD484_g532, partial [Candolleomyces efflorescens]
MLSNYILQEFMDELVVAQAVDYMVVDFIQTFPDEVRLMWPAPRSGPKAVFYILRYYGLVHSVFILWCEQLLRLSYFQLPFKPMLALDALPKEMGAEQCRIAFIRLSVSSMLAMTASEVILYIRVYAFAGRNKKLLPFLVSLFIAHGAVTKAIHTMAYLLFIKFIRSIKFHELLVIHNFICTSGYADSVWLGAVFSATLASVLVVTFTMMYIAYRYRGVSNSLLCVFYQDGISYFVSLSVLACANILINLLAPGGYKFLFVEYVL